MKIIQGAKYHLDELETGGLPIEIDGATAEQKITHVLSVDYITWGSHSLEPPSDEDHDFYEVMGNGIKQYVLEIDDDLRDRENATPEEVAYATALIKGFISNVFHKSDSSHTWFVHCTVGVSRSPAFVAGLFRSLHARSESPGKAIREMLMSAIFVNDSYCGVEPNQFILSIFDDLYPPVGNDRSLVGTWKDCQTIIHESGNFSFRLEDLLASL